MKILITGSNGQLGQCLNAIKGHYPKLELHFTDSTELDITNKKDIEGFFREEPFDYAINCAAYTNVEQAEKEPEKAFLVNSKGVKNLAEVCKQYETTLIHVSTDYVFDGEKETPYTEEDIPIPISVYGKSKLEGEKHIQEVLNRHFIIRTSWLYSEFGKNFFRTILSKFETKDMLTITTSEIGTPTNAHDLTKFIVNIINIQNQDYGIYHFSNLSEATWYDFAKEILNFSGKLDSIKLEKTDYYPTFAQRPKYSVLSKVKIQKKFDLEILEWKKSLKKLMLDLSLCYTL